KIVQAARLVRKGRVYSLGLPIQKQDVPIFPTRMPPMHFMTRDGGDYAAGRKARLLYQSADDYLFVACHGVTHIDALAHLWYDDKLYNGFSANHVRSDGARRCGIDKI